MIRTIKSNSYDPNDKLFIKFFKNTRGYDLESCLPGWQATYANPNFPLSQLTATYLKTGEPVPPDEMVGIQKVWAVTREKLRVAWLEYNPLARLEYQGTLAYRSTTTQRNFEEIPKTSKLMTLFDLEDDRW